MERALELEKTGQLSEAWTVLEQVSPDYLNAQKLRSRIRYRQGDIAAARAEAVKYAELLARSLKHAPLTELFDECLRQAIADNKEPELSQRLWPRLNLPASSKSDWLVRLRWGLRINKRLGHWILANRDRLDELDDVVDPPDWSPLDTAKAEGKPVVVAGAHLGPATLALHYLYQIDHPLVMLVGNLYYSLITGSRPFLLADQIHNILELRDTLSELGTVYLVADGPMGRSSFPATFLGSPTHLREGAATLARISQAQTFWYSARWMGRRIKLDLIPGPTASPHESRVDWNTCWFSFYLAQFEASILAGPENIRRLYL